MKKYSRCMSNYCGATNPRIMEQDFKDLPKEIQAELKKRNLDKNPISRCGFCGQIWVDVPDADSITVGVNDVARGRVWKILAENPGS